MLRREQKIRNIILFTFFSLVFIGVGYAVISSNLTLNGSMRLNKITWDVHFENFEELYDNTVTATKTLSNNNTTLTYNVNLNKPGDIFEFTIDVVNKGNIDAMLSNIGKNGLTAAQQQVMDYNVTYLDGSTPTVKDSLKIGEVETFVISVKTKANITNAQLNATDTNLSLTFNPTYAQDDKTSTARPNSLYSTIVKNSVLDNKASTYVTSASGINFNNHSSDENGKGIYLYSTTVNDNNPVYYYRGDITDNNVKLADYCWLLVRTTSTGGIKMIYNGTADSNGKCTKPEGATFSDSVIATSTFNYSYISPTYVGYMHGSHITYGVEYIDGSTSYKYGKSYSYNNGVYTLTGLADYSNDTHHFTCYNDTGTCEKIKFIYYSSDSYEYYFELENNEDLSELFNNMFSNNYESDVKIIIDNWFEQNLISKEKYMKDEEWCGSRAWNDTVKNGLSGEPTLGLETPFEFAKKSTPTVSCEEKRDTYTVHETDKGNGKLRFPIALISRDDSIFSGLSSTSTTSPSVYTYLDTGFNSSSSYNWWTMTPSSFTKYASYMYAHGYNGVIEEVKTNEEYGVRPSISLRKGIKIASGDGTQNNPYIIN